MVRISFFVFGYRKLFVSEADVGGVISMLLRCGISAQMNSKKEICVKESDFERAALKLNGKFDFRFSEVLGIRGAWGRVKYKRGLICGAVLSVIIAVISSSLVWDVRIEGNSSIPSSVIEYELSKHGLAEGAFWRKCHNSDIEASFLSAYPSVSWININRRGGVAYVKIAESEGEDEPETVNKGYANIVAACDCVIEEITVHRGSAAVKPGDVVKRGDVLIAGVTENEYGGEYCFAEGEIRGRISDTVTVNVDRIEAEERKSSEELVSVNVQIFNFPINIFKKYRNLESECVIIENTRVLSLFGKCNLPIRIISSYCIEYQEEREQKNDAQLVRAATERLTAATMKRLVCADLLRIRTYGDYTESGYEMSSHIVFLADVGVSVAFSKE